MRCLSVVAALLISTVAASADPVGSYSVVGSNPGNGAHYSGSVSISKTGDTYRVVWTIGGTQYVGTGIGNHDFLAVSYRSDNSTGLALYGADGGNWAGIWTYAGGRQVGEEVWNRRSARAGRTSTPIAIWSPSPACWSSSSTSSAAR